MDHAPARSRLTAAASLLAALGLLVGVPAVLATVVGWPLPRQAPDLTDVRDAFDRGDVDPQVLVKALAVVVWVAWAQLAWAIVVEAIAHARGGVARARVLLPGTQHLARQLVASAALVLTTLTPARAAVAAPLDPAIATTAPEVPDRPAAVPATRSAATAQPATRPYTVEAGDSWWGLAQRFLGSGTRWREVRDLNTGRQVAPGRSLGDREDTLLVGWTIAIPADTAAASPPVAPPGARVVAQAGDDLWSLATDHLARTLDREPTDHELGRYWQATLEANTGAGDPNVIAVGQELVLPPTPMVAEDAADSAAPEPDGERVVTVMPGDSPWSLAEAHLGDGARWPELLAGNQDRIQPDGRTWDGQTGIHPGWQLVVPTAARAPAAPRAPASAPAPAETSDEPTRATPPSSASVPAGEAPARPATRSAAEDEEPSDEPGPVAAPSTTAEPNAGDGDRPADRTRDLPEPTEASHPQAPGTVNTTAPPTTEAPASSDGTARPHGPDSDNENGYGDETNPVAPVLGVASTVLAVALLRSLRRRRARRAAQLPVTVVPPPPPTSSHPSASEIVGSAGEDTVDRLDAALAHLAAQLRPRGGEPCPQPRLVQVTGERIEVLLDRADPAPPPPWRPEASGQVWVLDTDVDLAPTDSAPPVPALVTIGTGDSDILVDLEAFGVVALVGDPDACTGLARSIVTELAARAEGTLGIDVIGLDDLHLDGLDGVRALDSWDDADTGVIAGSARMLDAGRWPHTFAARASGRVFDGWAPAVFVTADTDHPSYHEAIEQAGTRPGAGSAIVVVGADHPLGHGTRLVVDGDGRFHIPELGLTGQAQHLAAEVVEQVIDLLDDADHLPVAQTLDFPLDNPGAATGRPDADAGPSGAARPLAPDAPYEDPVWDVLVRVCGEICLEGGKDRLPAREMAVATYVALNRTADIDQLRDAVWAGADISRKRVQNVVSTVRTTLGGEAIYYVDEGRLAASPTLVTDLSLVERRLAYARHQDDLHDRADTLRDALAWATGKVCTYPSTAGRAWRWIDLDNWIATVESAVGTVAYELANLYLELGDSDGAIWAARRGLDATGPREQLTLLLVRGYELAGDTPAAAATLRSYEAHMDDLGTAEHSEATLSAIDRLLPRRPGRAAS